MRPLILQPSRPQVLELALRMRNQIRQDGLAPGDRFLTAQDAARRYQVRKDVANRALQIMVQQGVLTRKPRLGAVVVDPYAQPNASFDHVEMLVQEDYKQDEAHQEAAVLAGLQEALPGANIQIRCLPTVDAVNSVDNLIHDSLKRDLYCAVILVRGSYTIQKQLSECGLPAVVFGSCWPGLSLPWLNADNHQIADMLTTAILDAGCTHVLLLRRDRAIPGKTAFLQGCLERVANSAGARLSVLELPDELNLVAREVACICANNPGSEKLGVIGSTRLLTRAAWQGLTHVGMKPAVDVPIACASFYPEPGLPEGIIKPTPEIDFATMGRILGSMLLKQNTETRLHPLNQKKLIRCRLA